MYWEKDINICDIGRDTFVKSKSHKRANSISALEL